MSSSGDLQRFLIAQEKSYFEALSEINSGKKQSHWMWYIFPQIKGLAHSETAKYYALVSLHEARLYFEHPVLGSRLIEIANVLLKINNRTAIEILGSPDDLKLKSCMTLFHALQNTDQVFKSVLNKYYQGEEDLRTLELIDKTTV